jgi:hypothetical protein
VAWYVVGGLVAVAVVVIVLALRPTPQIGTDEAVFKTVDALYTAVRNRDEVRLSECEKRLHEYRDAGSLPKDACEQLDSVIARARSGKWESAAERLYDFIRAQEGGPEHAPRKAKTSGAKK